MACNQISEFVHTLVLSMQTEFMSVSLDITQIAENMGILEKYLESVHLSYLDSLRKCDPKAQLSIDNATKFYDALMKELQS